MLEFDWFEAMFQYLADLKGWKVGEKTPLFIYKQIAALVDNDTFERLAEGISNQDYAKPDSIIKAVKENRRTQALNGRPQLPAGPARPEVSVELGKFMRFSHWLADKKKGKVCCPYDGCEVGKNLGQGHCQCFEDVWQQELAPGWDKTLPITNPVAVAMGVNPHSMPDPKENDVVWVDA
jgi:hypothetical protein